MKKLFEASGYLFIFLLAALLSTTTVKAQAPLPTFGGNMDTVINSVTKDTVIAPKHAALIEPIVVNYQGDQAYSLSWSMGNLNRDTTVDGIAFVNLNGKKGQSLVSYSVTIPKSIMNANTNLIDTVDDYIFSLNKRYKKK